MFSRFSNEKVNRQSQKLGNSYNTLRLSDKAAQLKLQLDTTGGPEALYLLSPEMSESSNSVSHKNKTKNT